VTLIEFPDVIQGSDEWHDQRRGIVTASVVSLLLTPKTQRPAANDKSRSIVAQLVAERITGYTDPTYVSDDMLRGVEDELRARDLYAEFYERPVREVGFLLRKEETWQLGYSPDGLVGDDGLIEVKAPRAKGHLSTILAGEVPADHMAQCQAGLLVSGREWRISAWRATTSRPLSRRKRLAKPCRRGCGIVGRFWRRRLGRVRGTKPCFVLPYRARETKRGFVLRVVCSRR